MQSIAHADAIAGLAATRDYRTNPVPPEVLAELDQQEGPLTEWTGFSNASRQKLAAHAEGRDVNELLDASWEHARATGALRWFAEKGRVSFPADALRDDGTTPVELTIGRNARAGKPWFLIYVDAQVQEVAPQDRLMAWAYLGYLPTFLHDLAAMALPERWSQGPAGEDGAEPYDILWNYVRYTFYRLQATDCVLEDVGRGIAAFDTGLVNAYYEPIYACFEPNDPAKRQPWRFAAFCEAGAREWGKRLVAAFSPLPPRARYFERADELFFDNGRALEYDAEHILVDNVDRLPAAFLLDELRRSAAAQDLVRGMHDEGASAEQREASASELRDLLQEDPRLLRGLRGRLDDAVDLARKRAEWNFRTAVPSFYPRTDTMCLLLPLALVDDDHPDVALVVSRASERAYQGETILTMAMAYGNARLVCRPESDWLTV